MLREWTQRDYQKLWLTGNLKEGKNEVVPEELGEMGYTVYSHEWNRSKNGRMEQSEAMEYGSRWQYTMPCYTYTLLALNVIVIMAVVISPQHYNYPNVPVAEHDLISRNIYVFVGAETRVQSYRQMY
jgi:hypothetical protein